MDVNQQVVFFTPKGRALFGAPPVNPEPGRPRGIGEEEATDRPRAIGSPRVVESSTAIGGRPPPEVDHAAAIPHYKRDSHVPWEVEARVWEVLDPA
jgi:hypothetical protein